MQSARPQVYISQLPILLLYRKEENKKRLCTVLSAGLPLTVTHQTHQQEREKLPAFQTL